MTYKEARKLALEMLNKKFNIEKIPSENRHLLTLSGIDKGGYFVFDLYIPGEKSEDAKVVFSIEINKENKRIIYKSFNFIQ